ncbi:MAG TPA: hypothetical protein VNM24_16795 [Burkholderiales bacterium]|jgi:uncharacterized membrane protein|nr:hypothetical protein [Burkholderiales bacterium]
METVQPRESLISVANLVYGLHSLSIAIGVLGAWTIVGAFVFGIPSIVAVIVNYVKRDEASGTWLESHFRWQIRTFWFALLWCLIAALLAVTIVGIPLAWAVLVVAGIWVIYRVVRGWLALADRRALNVPAA